jgi:hypothetical protein
MPVHTTQPLTTYITERELPQDGDTRVFEFVLSYQVERSNELAAFRWRWRYSKTQQVLYGNAGLSGYKDRHARELQSFVRQILRELKDKGERLYSIDGQQTRVRGEAGAELTMPSSRP